MPYCIQDKDGHCQNRHVSYFEPGGSDGGSDGGGGGKWSDGAGPGCIMLVVLALIVWWIFSSLDDWMESNRQKGRNDAPAGTSSLVFKEEATSDSTSGPRGYYVSREEVAQFQLELDRKKAQSSSLRLRELDGQYASEELEFAREIERVEKETARLLPKLDEQYAAKVREFKEALRLGDFELAKRKDAESLQLLDKRNALEVEGATRVNEILKQKLAAIKAAIERIRAD